MNKTNLGNIIHPITDYHANGSYKILKENVTLKDDEDFALMIRTKNFEQNDFKNSNKFIDENAYHFLKKSKVLPGDIIMNKIANAGTVYLMPDLARPVSLAMNLFLIRPDEKKVNPKYVYLFLKINEKYVKSFSQGSVTLTITKAAVRNLEIDLPNRSIQDQIVKIFEIIESKIEVNNKMNQTLEEISKTIFKSWFIDFEPTRAKAEGRPTGLSKEISELFPDSFVSSEIGEIPKGWHVGNIEAIAEKVSDKYKNEDDWSNEKLIDLSRMPSNSIALNSYGQGDELSTSVCKFQKYDFLFGSIRPYFYKAGICPFDGVSNTSVFILRAKKIFDKEFMYFYSSSEKTFEKSVQYSDGTKMPIIKWNDFKEFQFALPSEELRTHFSSKIRPIVDKIILNIEEQETLTKLRDSLLPKLISGELVIPDAEGLIEETSI